MSKPYGFPRSAPTVAKRAGLDYKSLSLGEKAVFQAVWRALSEDHEREMSRLQQDRAKWLTAVQQVREIVRGI